MHAESSTAAGALRWVRAVVLAGIALLTAMVAHVSAGDRLPAAGPVVALLAAVTIGVAPLLRHPASTRRIVLLLVAGEAFLHLTLSALTPGRGHGDALSTMASSVSGPMAGMNHAALERMPDVGSLPGAAWIVHGVAGMSGAHILMAEAHVLAAVAVGLWLAAGERALWTLLCMTMGPLVTAVVALLREHSAPYTGDLADRICAPTADRRELPPHPWAQASRAVTRRGPPVGAPRPLGA